MTNGEPERSTLDVIRSKTAEIAAIVFSLPTLVAVMIGLCMIYVYRTSGSDGDISDIAFARGLITLLFSVGTIAIAVVLTFAALFQTDADAKGRFDRGKEVLGLLIGILGTIVGFYFGSLNPDSNRPLIQDIKPSSVVVNKDVDIVVTGEGFGGSPVLIIGSESIAVTSHTPNNVKAKISASQLSSPGTVQVRIVNTETGKTSNAQSLLITEKPSQD